jgi:ribosomal protein S12 methylthiotransferase accessory factor
LVPAGTLKEATIAIVGCDGAGSLAASSVAAMGVGRLLCIDSLPVTAADVSPLFGHQDIGEPRAHVLAARIAEFSFASVTVISTPIESDEDLAAALSGATFAITVDAGLAYRLNRISMRTGLRWTASSGSSFEAVLGPTIYPRQTACYVCYTMRTVACTDDPAAEFASLRSQEPSRDNNAAAASLIGQMLAVEAVKVVTGAGASAKGAIVVYDTLTMTSRRHEVLRVPSCPICGGAAREEMAERRPIFGLISPRSGLIRELRDVQPPAIAPLPPYLSQTILSNFDFRRGSPLERSAAGKGWTREEAQRGAIGEALERYCASVYDHSGLEFGAANADRTFIEPSAFVLYKDRQYAAAEFPFRRYEPGRALHWCRALRLDGTPVLVPASETYLSFPSYALNENFSLLTTTGLSAGETLDTAILGGLYELIERDAFVLNWMNRLTPAAVALDDLPLCEYVRGVFRRSEIDLHVFLLASDIPVPVAMAVTIDRSGRIPAAAVGLGCHLSGSRAVERAVLEACQVYASESGRAHAGVLTDPARGYDQVQTLEDHGGFFSIPERLHEFDHLFKGVPGALPEAASGDTSVDLATVTSAVEAAGASVAFIDLTTPDLRDFPVRVVRAFAAGLQPMHFGFGWERLGGTRLYSIAQRVGQDTRIRSEADLNFCPHPLP